MTGAALPVSFRRYPAVRKPERAKNTASVPLPRHGTTCTPIIGKSPSGATPFWVRLLRRYESPERFSSAGKVLSGAASPTSNNLLHPASPVGCYRG